MVETKTTKKVSEKLGQKGYNPRKTVELRHPEIRITSKEDGYNASKTVESRNSYNQKGYNPESSIRTRKPQQTTQKNSSSKNTDGKK